VHEVAQRIAPDSRVVYVDNDPLVLVHAQALLTSGPAGRTSYIHADLREPERILADPAVRGTLDFTKPIALILAGLLHFIPDEDAPGAIVARLMADLPSGSYLASTHLTPELDPEHVHGVERAMAAGGVPVKARAGAEFGLFFSGLEFVPPGLVPITEWRPAGQEVRPLATEVNSNGAVARKP
jgi:hypothetical protein